MNNDFITGIDDITANDVNNGHREFHELCECLSDDDKIILSKHISDISAAFDAMGILVVRNRARLGRDM